MFKAEDVLPANLRTAHHVGRQNRGLQSDARECYALDRGRMEWIGVNKRCAINIYTYISMNNKISTYHIYKDNTVHIHSPQHKGDNLLGSHM